MDIGYERGGGVLRLTGEIDAEVVASFLACDSVLTVSGAGVAPLLLTAVDLAEVTFLSCSAVSFLVRQTLASRTASHLPLPRGITRPARRVMDITDVTPLFQLAA